MSEANFTKGPWKFQVNNNDDLMTSFYGVSIGVNYIPTPTENSKLDAHLIAQAPAMYEMLESILKSNCRVDEFHMEIEALLTKARGEL